MATLKVLTGILIVGVCYFFLILGCESKEEHKAAIEADRQSYTNYVKEKVVMQDIEYGGHIYVVATSRTRSDTLSFIHHPACPCRPF